MKIDDQVEQRVRDTLHWAVKQKPQELEAAMRSFPDSSTRLAALDLLVAIAAHVSADAFGHRPSLDEIDVLAEEVAENEAWSSASAAEVAAFLRAAVNGTPLLEALPAESVVLLAFVTTASLLSSQPSEVDEWWFDYLDRVEAALEARPR